MKLNIEIVLIGVSISCDIVWFGVGVIWNMFCFDFLLLNVVMKLLVKWLKFFGVMYMWVVLYCGLIVIVGVIVGGIGGFVNVVGVLVRLFVYIVVSSIE